ncbi:MAG TPA: NAD(P)H-dependent oxidoreductase [Acetobacteraceae bacterium]|jgi:chromate reductase
MLGIAPAARLLGLSGSLRADSHSRAILRGLQTKLLPDTELTILDLDLPLYNQDDEGDDAPPQIQALRQAIRASDAVVIATPEYNHGMPGVLKNALDWASRPFGNAALLDKPVMVISASPAFTGGVRAQAQVNETLLAIGARVLAAPQVVIGGVHEKVRDGRMIDAAGLQFACTAIDRLLALRASDGFR